MPLKPNQFKPSLTETGSYVDPTGNYFQLNTGISTQIWRILLKTEQIGNYHTKTCSGAPGETRIMDLDQYLEKMNTNTNVI